MWVQSVRRRVRFLRSYLNMCQPNPRASPAAFFIPASRVGCSCSIRVNRWILEVFQQIPTKECAPSGLWRWRNALAARVRWPVQKKKCAACVRRRSGTVPTLECCWERIRQRLPVLYLHRRRRSHRLAPAESEQAEPSDLPPRLSLLLSHRRRTHIITFLLWLLSSWLSMEAVRQWANFCAPLQMKS